MNGPSLTNQSDINNLLSGLKTKQINVPNQNQNGIENNTNSDSLTSNSVEKMRRTSILDDIDNNNDINEKRKTTFGMNIDMTQVLSVGVGIFALAAGLFLWGNNSKTGN